MRVLRSAGEKWWGKPLVLFEHRHLPAELVVLAMELRPGESGAWLNSRGTETGVVDLVRTDTSYRTQRAPLPEFVSQTLVRLYDAAGVRKGCPDLVIWDAQTKAVRLVEVKCPQWDRPSDEQDLCLRVARSLGVPASVVEWKFDAAQHDFATRTHRLTQAFVDGLNRGVLKGEKERL